MSATSPVAICNRALTLVGAKTIISFVDGSDEAKLCNIHYEQVRDAVTMAYNWSHARTRTTLAPEALAPAHGFSKSYLLPPDCLLVQWVGNDPNGYAQLPSYTIEDGRVLCDVDGGINLTYLRRVTDTSKFVQLYTEALVARLAAELAIPLAESRSLAEQNFTLYTAKVDEAAAVDGQQGRNTPTEAVRHQRARWGFGTQSGYLPPGFYSWG